MNFDWSEMTAAFTKGHAIMELNWPAAIPDIDKMLPSTDSSSRWSVVIPPTGTVPGKGTSMIGNWLLGIPLTSKHADQGAKFIMWLMDQQLRVANEGRPPTRKSVFDQLAKAKPYFADIQKALEQSTPRDRTEKWSQIEEAVSRAVTTYLVSPDTVDAVSGRLQSDLERILR
jgi:multiple sugar transport system substrate-binding protein